MKNYMKLHIKKILPSVVLILLLTAWACEKDLETNLPQSQLTGESVFEEVSTARAALADVYSGLRDSSPVAGGTNGLGVLFGLYADELDYYGPPLQSAEHFYDHSILDTDPAVQGLWNNSYSIIYKCNAILEGLAASPLTNEEKEPLKGEALFLRSFTHFYLTNLFGDIPYITTTDYQQNSSVSRMDIDLVQEKMITDLQSASELLPETDATGGHVYATKGTAQTLLSRIYLYQQDWQDAATAANTVIDSGNFSWVDDLTTVFINASPSTIWQLPPAEGMATSEAQTFIFENGPPPYAALKEELVNSFEQGDSRRQVWIGTATDGVNSWYYPNKYITQFPGAGPEEASVLMRLAEVYLLRAEARAHLSDISGAQADLNKVRHRAMLGDTEATTESQMVTAVLEERRHELFTEQGQRWLDLKRTNQAKSVLQPLKPGWMDTDILLPLPQQELILNPNLKPQNPGY